MNDDIGLVESLPQNESAADAAYSPLDECRTDPTLVELVASAQKGWWRLRDAQLYVLAAGTPLLHFAEAHEKVFREYCSYVLGEINSPQKVVDPARASLETLAFALQVCKDPDAWSLTRAQRAEYASGLGWFAHLCPEADPDNAVALARSLGRLTGIAALYREHKDATDPSRQQRLAKARTTRARHATGSNGSTTSPEGSAALPPIDEARARPPEMAFSVGDDTVSAPVIPGSAASLHRTDNDVHGEPRAGANPTEKVELPSAVTNAAGLARAAIYRPELARFLVNQLWVLQGIRPAVHLTPSMSDQRVLGWLQVNGMFFGPVRDASICATIAAQLIIERLQH